MTTATTPTVERTRQQVPRPPAHAPLAGQPATPESLLEMEDGGVYELECGTLVPRHGWADDEGLTVGLESDAIALELFALLREHFPKSLWARVVPSSGGFRCFADDETKVRKPDLAFVRRDRLPDRRVPEGNADVPAEFAVEVRSPTDRLRPLVAKCRDYRANGFGVIWLVDVQRRLVGVFGDGGEEWYEPGDRLAVPFAGDAEVEVGALLDAADPAD